MQRFANNQPIEFYSIFNRTLVTFGLLLPMQPKGAAIG